MVYTKYFSSDLSNNPGQHESKAVGTKGYVRALRSEAEIRWMELSLVLRKQRENSVTQGTAAGQKLPEFFAKSYMAFR